MASEADSSHASPQETNEGDDSHLHREQEAEDSDEEDECRVCRGPAEEGRPLFAPCKCSGSIGLTHQDCLASWLAVTRGDGRCELCKTKFRFDPQYADNAPDRLPAHEVLLGLSSRAVAKWLPLALRFLMAASLWLLVAPLITTYLYHGWIHRPSSIPKRWKRDLLPADIVSGAVVVAVIIISFLSLMSFADFLRVHWQQPPRRGEEQDEQAQRRNDVANGFLDDNNNNPVEGGVDEEIANHIRTQNQQRTQNVDEASDEEDSQRMRVRERPRSENDGDEAIESTPANNVPQQPESNREQFPFAAALPLQQVEMGTEHSEELTGNDDEDDVTNNIDNREEGETRNDMLLPPLLPDAQGNNGDRIENGEPPRQLLEEGHNDHDTDEDEDEDEDDDLDDDDLDDDDEDEDDDDDDDDAIFPERNDERVERPFDPMDPVLQDDQVDMEINVALDELLGLRGPLSTLLRNLLWLLAFNATYLGIFAFVPRAVGSTVYSGMLNTTASSSIIRRLPYFYSENEDVTVLNTLSSIHQESIRLDTSFRLTDLSTVTLGYFAIASVIVLVRYGWILSQKIRTTLNLDRPDPIDDDEGEARRLHNRIRLQRDRQRDEMNGFQDHDGLEPAGAAASVAVGMALDATVAVVKVGVLLFLKMFLLPILLGLWLDGSTMSLFGNELSDRINYAGSDLFSFILLHWVAGITFMLLVTVFLLQLREVTHPDLLARLIRPQEPQPDLLGNLMHESVSTHMKRMFLSLGIYAPLLTMHVSVPVKLFVASGIGETFSFYRLNFWHVVMPQMQIPLELIMFHLSMLALLERYKNSIGELQHRWLMFMCRRMGLTDYILPRSVEKFQLFGVRPIYLSENAVDRVDPFWYDLALKDKDFDDFVLSNIERCPAESPAVFYGESKVNGERVLEKSVGYIRLPKIADNDIGGSTSDLPYLLPTKIGRFRLKRADSNIQVWQEVQGPEIPRPPEGWDDLGAGGAYAQGRWAWGRERKSEVEWSVAQRMPFRSSEQKGWPILLMLKLLVLLFFSWIAITFTVCGIISTPLAVGRSIYYLFRIPQHYIHDPLAFCIGGCLFFPILSMVVAAYNETTDETTMTGRLRSWASRFHLPSKSKLKVFLQSFILWFVVAPFSLGISYEVVAVKRPSWFSGEVALVNATSLVLCWLVGCVVLNSWAFLAYFSVFTREFWANIGNGILEPPLEENNGGAAAAAAAPAQANQNPAEDQDQPINDEQQPRRSWQGKEGRVASFFSIQKKVLVDWEWEAVDPVFLLDDFAFVVSNQVVRLLAGSLLFYFVIVYGVGALTRFDESGIVLPFLGVTDIGTFRMAVFRICMISQLMLQLCTAFRAPLERWFQAAHKAARDDRYLIGEVLMNYVPEDSL